MSSPSTAAQQGSSGDSKKRRPNFRPTSLRKSTSTPKQLASPSVAPAVAPPAPAAAAEAAPDLAPRNDLVVQDPLNLPERVSQTVQETPLVKEAPKASAAATAHSTPPTSTKRGRKRKKTGVEVGVSRPQEPPSVESPAATTTLGDDLSSTVTATATGTPLKAATDTATLTSAAAVPDAAAAATTSATSPRLSSYCSKFRSKRKTKDKTTQPAAAAAGLVHNHEDSATTAAAPTGPVVQIVNGEIVLQESSLLVGAPKAVDDEFPVVEEDAQPGAVVGASYNSFVNRRAPQHWTVEETQLFYEALRQVGTDFGTMQAYFGNKRTRKQLKRKFQIESTKNPDLIDMALDPSALKAIDLSVFKVSLGDATAKAKTSTSTHSNKAQAALSANAAAIDRAALASKSTQASTKAPPRTSRTSRTIATDDDDDDEELILESTKMMEPLWPDHAPDTDQVIDPLLLHQEQEEVVDQGISLVPSHGTTKTTSDAAKAKSKPKFRSRRAKKKA